MGRDGEAATGDVRGQGAPSVRSVWAAAADGWKPGSTDQPVGPAGDFLPPWQCSAQHAGQRAQSSRPGAEASPWWDRSPTASPTGRW